MVQRKTRLEHARVTAEGLAEHVVIVRSDYIPHIQEVHGSAYHVLRRRIDDVLVGC